MAQRMGQPATLFEIVVPPGAEFCEAVLFEELRRGAVGRQFPSSRLGAFLTKLGWMRIGGLGPAASYALEALDLVLAGQLPQRFGRYPLPREDIRKRAH